jgi:hypothetical protein
LQDYVHAVGHDHPGGQEIEIPAGLAVPEGIGHHASHPGILQPNRSESGFIDFTVRCEKGSTGG